MPKVCEPTMKKIGQFETKMIDSLDYSAETVAIHATKKTGDAKHLLWPTHIYIYAITMTMDKTRLRIRPSPRRTCFLVNCYLLFLLFSSVTLSVSGAADTQPTASTTLSLSPPNGLAAEDNHEHHAKKEKKKDGILSQLQHSVIEGVSLSSQHRPLRTNHHHATRLPVFWRHDDDDDGCLLRQLRGGAAASNEVTIASTTRKKNSTTSAVKTTPLSAEWMDQQAKAITLAFAWVVVAQALGTALHACRAQFFEVCAFVFVLSLFHRCHTSYLMISTPNQPTHAECLQLLVFFFFPVCLSLCPTRYACSRPYHSTNTRYHGRSWNCGPLGPPRTGTNINVHFCLCQIASGLSVAGTTTRRIIII